MADLNPTQKAANDQDLAAIADAGRLPLKACTLQQLVDLNDHALEIGYNRALDPDWLIENIPLQSDWCLVRGLMYHDHIAGHPAPRHLRCFVYIPIDGGPSETRVSHHQVLVDMSITTFEDLIPAKELVKAVHAPN